MSGDTIPGKNVATVPLIEARNIVKHFPLPQGLGAMIRRSSGLTLKAVDGVSLAIAKGETVGLVGESGCGKTTFGRCLVRLYEPTSGEIRFKGEDFLAHDGATTRKLRQHVQMIFQDPYSSLNPRKKVKDAIGEALKVHRLCPVPEIPHRVGELLLRVGLSPEMGERYPRQFSGGQRQRIGIARALAVNPQFIVADEAVSALDVSIQAQVLNVLRRLQEELGLTYLFIAHNLGVVRHFSDRVAVMYLGKIVEIQGAEEIFDDPLHPYTKALVQAIPRLSPAQQASDVAIEGDPPSPVNIPSGCRFHPRCPYVMDVCRVAEPALTEQSGGKSVACHLYPSSIEDSTM